MMWWRPEKKQQPEPDKEFKKFLREISIDPYDYKNMPASAKASIVESFIKWQIARIQFSRDRLAQELEESAKRAKEGIK